MFFSKYTNKSNKRVRYKIDLLVRMGMILRDGKTYTIKRSPLPENVAIAELIVTNP